MDVPPILCGADTMVMAPYVDGIVMVVESGKTPFKEIQSAMERVPKEKFLGFVLNKHAGRRSVYYTRYNKPAQASRFFLNLIPDRILKKHQTSGVKAIKQS